MTEKTRFSPHFQGNIIAGLLTITPLVVVWVVFRFFYNALAEVGGPVANGLIAFLAEHVPSTRAWLTNPDLQQVIAFVIAILLLYCIGAITSRMVGRKAVEYLERLVARIPVVQSIYAAARKLVNVLQQKPEGGSRVVLIAFPHPGLRAIGFLMRTFHDATTGEELAAVYVPTAPNPTSGYLEIVPIGDLMPTDMSMDQAMTMILSGGATAPDKITIG